MRLDDRARGPQRDGAEFLPHGIDGGIQLPVARGFRRAEQVGLDFLAQVAHADAQQPQGGLRLGAPPLVEQLDRDPRHDPRFLRAGLDLALPV